MIRADAMGMCFGVRDALAAARQVPDPSRVTIHGELVHNERVLADLRARGFRLTDEADRGRPDTPVVMITAHGVSDRERARLVGKRLLDTTCPLVRRVHGAAQALARRGYHVLVVGKRGHVEVKGIVEDLASCDVLETPDQVRTYPHTRLGVVCQTTAATSVVEPVMAAVEARNPHAEIRFVDTVCKPTKDRQRALERLLDAVEAVVVVGGRNSNNTRRLVERCSERGVPAYHVQGPGDLDADRLARHATVGLTAGTSTPADLIDAVAERLATL